MKNAAVLLLALALSPCAASAERPAAPPPLPDWAENVRTNAAAASEADFRDRSLLPLLRAETLDRFEPPPAWSVERADEARAYVENELRLAWEGAARMTNRPGSEWGRAYDFTVKEGSRDPFLVWMSVVGQHKWHWDDKARAQLSALEADLAALPPEAEPFRRLLAAHARQLLDPAEDHARALCSAAVRWAESQAVRPDRSEAVLRVLAQFVDTGSSALVPAFLRSSADPWIAFALGGDAALGRARGAVAPEARDEALDLAAASYRRAWELHPDFPQGAAGMAIISGLRRDREGLRLWFARAAEARFDLVRLHLDCGLHFGDPASRRAHEDACLALAGERPGTMLPLCGMAAVIRELNAGGAVAAALLSDPGRLARIESALESVARSPGATRSLRWAAAELVAVLRERRGDVDGALRACDAALDPIADGFLQARVAGTAAANMRLGGISGPNREIVRPLAARFEAGDFEGVLDVWRDVWRRCAKATRNERRFLSDLFHRAFLRARFEHGESRFVGILLEGEFCEWFGHADPSGTRWTPEVAPGGGSAVASDGARPCALEFRHALPAAVEIETECEFLPGEGGRPLFALWFLPADGFVGRFRLRGPQPALSLSPDAGGDLRIRLCRGDDFESAGDGSDGPFAERVVPFPASPDGPLPEADADRASARRVRLRVVFTDGRIELFLGADRTPVLSESCPAFGPAAMPNGGKPVFFGRGVRFRGFSFRKPLSPPRSAQEG